MNTVAFPMKQGGILITLADILRLAKPGGLIWKLLEFSGVGTAPRNLAMKDFEALVTSRGYSMNWEELNQFAGKLEQTWDCLLVGIAANNVMSRQDLLRTNCRDADIVIEGIDSTEWRIRTNDPALFEALSSGYGKVSRLAGRRG